MSFKTGYAYFTDWRLGAIVRVRKSDGGEMTIIRRGISNIMHVKAYDAHSQIGELICCTGERYEIQNKRQYFGTFTQDVSFSSLKWLYLQLWCARDTAQMHTVLGSTFGWLVTVCGFSTPYLFLYLIILTNGILIPLYLVLLYHQLQPCIYLYPVEVLVKQNYFFWRIG